jgi:hypothetical protein
MVLRDIDRIIADLQLRIPGVAIEQLKVKHPGVDDDGLWFIRHPAGRFEAQLESPDGMFPFLLESDGDLTRAHLSDLDDVASAVLARLGLPG